MRLCHGTGKRSRGEPTCKGKIFTGLVERGTLSVIMGGGDQKVRKEYESHVGET